ncbi:nickel pincer cofactor biosynthesis protein LarB [Clostridium algoriphilum]|uniref:nickel pincer cofactor biosynthesis protein LarB n=1 Tax=Clostridium algoriphilum TaxID=198347 RepID=UPI001CF31BFA|nr:nickel pincer cofactor biosynthesis protein LarB [Clostridium algoriphilum]MCB2293138.1 nickel pincer cofactor biosynthesis protein LarB [Clostridium algoriphilum]
MNSKEMKIFLKSIKNGDISIEDGMDKLKDFSYSDLGFAKIDNHRELRVGYPEVIYCEGKTVEQIKDIVSLMITKDVNILGTRASGEMYDGVRQVCDDAEYNELARTIVIKRKDVEIQSTYIALVTGGTSDIPVAEEAAITAEIFGNKVERIYDVGVAGIHRLFENLDVIRRARVVITVAGMEGALTSVVGGLVDKPVIAVPTSVGYGASFKGLAALLSMLNSCSSGVSVVNIDNGFGAGYLASIINKL